jgi:hypothetical protein
MERNATQLNSEQTPNTNRNNQKFPNSQEGLVRNRTSANKANVLVGLPYLAKSLQGLKHPRQSPIDTDQPKQTIENHQLNS